MATTAKSWMNIVFIILGMSFIGQTAWASKVYVTDSFRISLRRGPSIENKILKFIPSGLPVKVYETREGWSRICLSEGEQGVTEGWVLDRYLIKRLPWKNRTGELLKENAKLKEELEGFDKKWEETISREQQLSKELKRNYETTSKTAQRLAEENELLRSSRNKKLLTAGGLVLLSGLIAGLLVGKQPRRRRLSFSGLST